MDDPYTPEQHRQFGIVLAVAASVIPILIGIVLIVAAMMSLFSP